MLYAVLIALFPLLFALIHGLFSGFTDFWSTSAIAFFFFIFPSLGLAVGLVGLALFLFGQRKPPQGPTQPAQ